MKRTIEILSGAKRIILLPHIKPDGDTVGSCCALCEGLISLGRECFIYPEEPFTPKYAPMAEGLPVIYELTQADAVVAVDVAATGMLGDRGPLLEGKIDLCIDHHPSNTRYAGHTLLDPEAAATAEMIYGLIGEMGIELSANIARNLYTGLATDSGCFRFSNTTPRTMRIGADLMERAGSVEDINNRFFAAVSRAKLEAQKTVLGTLAFFAGGRGASIVISQDIYAATGASEDDVDSFTQIPREIEGVEVGVTYKQCLRSGWRISMRSNGKVDVSALCAKFGGGGHKRAAGCSLDRPLDEVRAAIEAAVTEVLESERTD